MVTEQPTCEQLFLEDGLKSVHREADDSWRHGAYIYEVFRREADDTFWSAAYELSTDGESHGLREGTADIKQVRPVEKTTIEYQPVTD